MIFTRLLPRFTHSGGEYFGQTTWLTAKITIRIMRAIVILKEVCYEINLDDHCDDHKLCVGICVYRRFTGICIRCR